MEERFTSERVLELLFDDDFELSDVVTVTQTVVKVLLTLGMMNFNLRSWMP